MYRRFSLLIPLSCTQWGQACPELVERLGPGAFPWFMRKREGVPTYRDRRVLGRCPPYPESFLRRVGGEEADASQAPKGCPLEASDARGWDEDICCRIHS